MLQLIRTLLNQFIDDIDARNTNISEEQQKEVIDLIQRINSKKLSKLESADYIGVSRATFDNYVNKGLIPKGEKRQGVSSLFWNKSDLDNYLKTKNKQ